MGKHSILWIALIAFCFIGMPAISTPADITKRVLHEIAMIESALGKTETRNVTESAANNYKALFEDTGLVKTTRRAMVTEEEKSASEAMFGGSVRAITDRTNDYVLGFSALCYAMLVRLAIVLAWLPYIAPFFLAVIVDSVVTRRVKFETFKSSSPIKFSVAGHMIIVVLFLPVLYLVVPLPVTPLFIPFWTLLSSLPVMILIANTQRV